MIVINVIYHCKEGKRDEFLKALLAEGLDKKCQTDAGNIKYDYYLPAAEDGTLLLVERWKDEESLKAHIAAPHMARIGELKNLYVDHTELQKMESE